jgi:N6-adenosine-specific RNA methylase IME4
MTTNALSWVKENYFLGGLAVALFSITAYVVRLETRVATLETRGSPHLAVIDNRLTVLESTTNENKRRLDNVINIMTKELHISPGRQ